VVRRGQRSALPRDLPCAEQPGPGGAGGGAGAGRGGGLLRGRGAPGRGGGRRQTVRLLQDQDLRCGARRR